MNEIIKNLLIGTIGSVIGALLVLYGSQGWQLTRESREKRKQRRQIEENQWISMDIGIRQSITNSYLFDILKYILIGNLFFAISNGSFFLDVQTDLGFLIYRVLSSICGILAFFYFFIGLGRANRYLKLRRLDNKKICKISDKLNDNSDY
jgi:hypothetical protein